MKNPFGKSIHSQTRSQLRGAGLALLLAAASAQVASAQLLVEEAFSYGIADGATLVGQTITGTGFTTNWQETSGTGTFVYATTNLSFGSLINSGGSAVISSTSGRAFGGTLSASATVGSTLYGAYLVNISAFGGGTTALHEVRVNTGAATAGGSSYFRSQSDSSATSVNGTAVAYDNTPGTAGATLSLNTTYIVLSEYTNVGAALSGGSPGTATQWVLTLDQFNNFRPDGLTVLELNGATVGTGTTNVFSRTSDSVTSGTGGLFDGSRAVQFAAVGATGLAATANYDALRYGTSLDLVTPIPEPSTWALVGLGLSAVLFLRRRRMSV